MYLSNHPTKEEASKYVASLIINRINTFEPTQNRKFVLCLPTGSTPLLVYKELARKCEGGEISFEHVITINLDEYVGLSSDHPQSYYQFMEENFDIPSNQFHLLPGLPIPPHTTPQESCASYESLITSLGGIHLLFMGIGENGHIAFNEPCSSFRGRTRVVKLNEGTRKVNARFFDDPSEVPRHALSMGVGTIIDSQEIVVLAIGQKKAEAVRKAMEDGVNHLCPASALQLHEKVILVTDDEASQNLRKTVKDYLTCQPPCQRGSMTSSIGRPGVSRDCQTSGIQGRAINTNQDTESKKQGGNSYMTLLSQGNIEIDEKLEDNDNHDDQGDQDCNCL
ncbi:glucosamine-6-phosphate deaminase [Kwoniella europaea PYCC6329]|uniref:Glucosamine-6-phosphate isomerase n=1 Tax=Kwoniella europaea PYCC6329 TaxID=1423913 RepID=A0AAX4KSG7_9TREE